MKNRFKEMEPPGYTYKKVISMTHDRLVLGCKEKTVSISFAECIQNYANEMGSQSQGIGTRNITELKFTFYTNPKTVIVWKRPRFVPFWRVRARKQFIQLQKAMKLLGYRTFDLS